MRRGLRLPRPQRGRQVDDDAPPARPDHPELGLSDAAGAPLDGTITLARGSGVEVVVLHVHEEERLPRFSERLQHEARAYAEEFVARNCPCPPEEVKLELRVGAPHEHLVQVVRETSVDLVAVGWSQELAGGRAAVVREALSRCRVPNPARSGDTPGQWPGRVCVVRRNSMRVRHGCAADSRRRRCQQSEGSGK